MNKRCTKCGEDKPPDQYPKGRRECKACRKAYNKQYYAATREHQIATSSAYRKANPDKIAVQRAGYREANRAALCARNGAWQKANPAIVNANNRKWSKANADKCTARNAALRFGPAVPPWYPLEKAAIYKRYTHSRLIRELGGDCQVDHIIPLNHPQVSGLHTLANLQLITKEANRTKNNTFDPDAHHQPNHRRLHDGSE